MTSKAILEKGFQIRGTKVNQMIFPKINNQTLSRKIRPKQMKTNKSQSGVRVVNLKSGASGRSRKDH